MSRKLIKLPPVIAKTKGRKTWPVTRYTAERDLAMIQLLLDTGLRASEVCRLRVRDVNVVTGEVAVLPFGTGRKTKPRTVYLGKVSRKSVWRYLATREDPQPDEHLFLLVNNAVMDRMDLLNQITRLGRRAGVKPCHPHKFRHTFAIEFVRNGGDVFTFKRLLGHETLSMVNHYVEIARGIWRQRTAEPVRLIAGGCHRYCKSRGNGYNIVIHLLSRWRNLRAAHPREMSASVIFCLRRRSPGRFLFLAMIFS